MTGESDQAGAPGSAADRPAGHDEDPSELTSTISMGSHEHETETGLHDPEQAAADALPAGAALLVVRKGPDAGSRFVLEAELVTAGRHPDSDIFLDDVTVSRRHAQFIQVEGGFDVKDVGSLNGTYVNRERIDQVRLAGLDEVQIGKYRLVYLVGPSAAGHEHPGEPGS